MIVVQGISSDLNDVNDCRVDLMLGRCLGGGYGARQGQWRGQRHVPNTSKFTSSRGFC